MEMIWLRDYDLAEMKKRINDKLMASEDPNDCVVNIQEVEKAIIEVFDGISLKFILPSEIGIGGKDDYYFIIHKQDFDDERKRHLSTFAEEKGHNSSSKKVCPHCKRQMIQEEFDIHVCSKKVMAEGLGKPIQNG